uniref:Uncharacterized protein n=1 Tax=Clytia hemisphaerica TaxID=252671 RepID=A0A7M5UZW3_9CNID
MNIFSVRKFSLTEIFPSEVFPDKVYSTCFSFLGRALPPIETHTNINRLMLQSKKINLNPFPEDFADQLLYAPQCNCVQSNLITLRYSRKYFIPSQSFVM